MNNHELETDVSELHEVVARLLSDISSLSTLAIKLDQAIAKAEEKEEDKELDDLLELEPSVIPKKKRGRGRPPKYEQY